MKIIFSLFFLLSASMLSAQNKKAAAPKKADNTPVSKVGAGVRTIIVKNEPIYLITNLEDYDIYGLYENVNGDFDSRTNTRSREPITELRKDGTGLWQNFGTNKAAITWGIECEKDGNPKKNESPYGAIYRLWYQIKEKFIFRNTVTGKVRESGEIDEWDIVEFSVNFGKKQLAILGDRVKKY